MKGVVIAVIAQSQTTPGVRYFVNLEKNYCSCPAWKFTKIGERVCKHLLAARLAYRPAAA